jgi:K+-sensing histidine kinase KdpD
MQVLRAQVARIAAAIDELTAYGSPRALTPAAAAPGDVLRAAARASAVEAMKRGVKVLVYVEAGLPPVVVDGPRLSRALAAIVKQAVCLSGTGASVAMLASRDDGSVAFDVGGGWAARVEDDLASMFEPFRVEGGCGGGLSLAIAKRVLDDHGAEIVMAAPPCERALRVRIASGPPPSSRR